MNNKNIIHKSFEIGLILKGINGILELLAGALLIFINPARLSTFVSLVTHSELTEDPHDLIANFIIRSAAAFSVKTQIFLVIYLIVHGVIKLGLVMLLWKRKLWAYPLTIISLILFIIYQLNSLLYKPSILLIFLTLFDLIMIVLTFLEYKNIKKEFK